MEGGSSKRRRCDDLLGAAEGGDLTIIQKKKRCGDLLGAAKGGGLTMIKKILVRLPVKSLLRFKAVSTTWRDLIQSSSFIDLHTTATTFKSSSSRFGSFIVHPAVEYQRFRKNALLMLSSVSESECVSKSKSWCSGSFGLWSSSGSNGICGECPEAGGAWWWSTNDDGCCDHCGEWNPYRVAEVDNNNNNILGGGGWWSNDDDDQQLLELKLDNLGFPSCYQFDKIRPIYIVGSCNGLICLYDEQPNEVSLWNPATRQFRILPKSSSKPIAAGYGDGDGEIPPHRLVAFGFDAETKDYKVVLLSFFNQRRSYVMDVVVVPAAPMECICRVEVYSYSTDSWSLLEGMKSLPGSPYPYPSNSSGLFYLNGSCFFLAKLIYSESRRGTPEQFDDRFIISLDLTKQIITPIQLPSHYRNEVLYLCSLGNRIALFTKIYFYGEDCSWERFGVWVFNELRISSVDNKSWRRIHSFAIILGIRGEMYIPRGISNDGVFALLETDQLGGFGKKKKKMKLYNLVTDKLKRNFLSCDQVVSKVYAYKPSLVSIKQHQPIGY